MTFQSCPVTTVSPTAGRLTKKTRSMRTQLRGCAGHKDTGSGKQDGVGGKRCRGLPGGGGPGIQLDRRKQGMLGEKKCELGLRPEGKPFHRIAWTSCWKGPRITLCCVATNCFLWPGWSTPSFLDGTWAHSCRRDASAWAAPGLPLQLAPLPPPLPSPPVNHNAENILDQNHPTRLQVQRAP